MCRYIISCICVYAHVYLDFIFCCSRSNLCFFFFDNRGVRVSLRAPWLILGPISSPTCEFPLKAMVGYMRGFGFETLRREQTSNSQALTSNLCFWRLWWSTALIFLLIFGIFPPLLFMIHVFLAALSLITRMEWGADGSARLSYRCF